MLVPDTASVVVQVLHGGYPRFGVAFAPRSGSVSDSKKVIARLLSARLADRGCQRRFSGSICFSRLTDEILNELLHHVSPMSRFQKPPGIVRCKRLIPRHRNRPILSFQKQVLLGGDGRTGLARPEKWMECKPTVLPAWNRIAWSQWRAGTKPTPLFESLLPWHPLEVTHTLKNPGRERFSRSLRR